MVLWPDMAETDVEKLTRLMLDEFGRVNERFDRLEHRFDGIETRLTSIESEVSAIHRRLDALAETVESHSGFAKEIDHLLKRVAEIEKHLGLQARIKA